MRIELVDCLKTVFYDGRKLWRNSNEWSNGESLYPIEERESWQQVIVLHGVKVIPQATFDDCVNITKIVLASTVIRIEESAFETCCRLVDIAWSENLEYIGEATFSGCISLEAIFLPSSCSEVDADAFHGCGKLILFVFPSGCAISNFRALRGTKLEELSPVTKNDDDEEEEYGNRFHNWLRGRHDGEEYLLHRICASYNPRLQEIHQILQEYGFSIFKQADELGITPSQYLNVNTTKEFEEVNIIRSFILKLMDC